MKNGTWLLLSLLCVLIVGGWLWGGFAVYRRHERKKEKTKTHHYLSMASFSLWILSSRSVAGTGCIFSGCKKNVSI